MLCTSRLAKAQSSELHRPYSDAVQNWLTDPNTAGMSMEVVDLPEMSLQMLSDL